MDDDDSDDEEARRKKKKKMWDEEEKARNDANESDYMELSHLVWDKVFIYIIYILKKQKSKS